jgi:cob(I)alamin adenosyltransferase
LSRLGYRESMRTPLFTGFGDGGTSRVGPRSLPKSSPFLAVIGMLDELNSFTGWCRVEASRAFPAVAAGDVPVVGLLKDIQNALFVAQAELASLAFGSAAKQPYRITPAHVQLLETLIVQIDAAVPKLSSFVVPGGTELATRLDVTRAVARRAERGTVALGKTQALSPHLLAFMNRLSSALFALARYANHRAGVPEEPPLYA